MSESAVSGTQGATASSSSGIRVEERTATSLTGEPPEDATSTEHDAVLPFDPEAEGHASQSEECTLADAAGEVLEVVSGGSDVGSGGTQAAMESDEALAPPMKFAKPGGGAFAVRQSKDDLSKDFALNLLPNMHAQQRNAERQTVNNQKGNTLQAPEAKKDERRVSNVSELPQRRTQRASTVAEIIHGAGERRQRSCSFALNTVSQHSTISQIQQMAEKKEEQRKTVAASPEEDHGNESVTKRGRSCSFALNTVSNHSAMHQIQQLAVAQGSNSNMMRLSKSTTQPVLQVHDMDAVGKTLQPKIEKKASELSANSDSSDSTSSDEHDDSHTPAIEQTLTTKSVRIAGDDLKSETASVTTVNQPSFGGEIVRRLSRMIPMSGLSFAVAAHETIVEEPAEGGEDPKKPKRRFSRAISATVQAVIQDEHRDEGDESHLPWIFTSRANQIFGILILINAVYMGAETDHYDLIPSWFWLTSESMFLVAFGVEIILRFRYHKRMPLGIDEEPKTFFRHMWNVLDFIIVVAGVFDTWIMTIIVQEIMNVEAGAKKGGSILAMLQLFRILRLLRIIRIFRFLKELLLLAQGIYAAMKGLVWATLLFGMTLYICSIVATRFLGKFDDTDAETLPEGHEMLEMWFGSVHASLFTLFQLATLENWPDVARQCMRTKGWATAFFFIIFLIITHFVLLNLVTGVILENVMAISRREEEKALQREEAVRIQTVMKIHRLFDAVLGKLHCGELSIVEFRQACLNPRVVRQLQDLQIATHEAEELFVLMDTSKRGCIDIDHFIEGCLRIRGVARAKHLLGVQYDVQKVWSKLSEQLDEVEDRILECLDYLLQESETRAERLSCTGSRGSMGTSRASLGEQRQRMSARERKSAQERSSMGRLVLENASAPMATVSDDAAGSAFTPSSSITDSATVEIATAVAKPAMGPLDKIIAGTNDSVREEAMLSVNPQPAEVKQPPASVRKSVPVAASSALGTAKKSIKNGRSSASEAVVKKLSASSLPGSTEAPPEAEVTGTEGGSGRISDFLPESEERRTTIRKSRTQGYLKKSWSRADQLGSVASTTADTSSEPEQTGPSVAEKALADKAMARLMSLQREEDRLRTKLEKVQQARETELLILQRYLGDSGPGVNSNSAATETAAAWAPSRSVPNASASGATAQLDRQKTLHDARSGALSPAPLETEGGSAGGGAGGAFLQRQRRVSLGGETLQQQRATEMEKRRTSVAAVPSGSSSFSPRRPSMGLGLLDSEIVNGRRRTSLHSSRQVLPTAAERHSTSEHGEEEEEEEESEHEHDEHDTEEVWSESPSRRSDREEEI